MTKNTNQIETIIHNVMSNAANDGSRQAQLTLEFYHSEVSCSGDEIIRIMKTEKVERTAAIDKLMATFSDQYETRLKEYNLKNELKKSSAGSIKRKLELELQSETAAFRAARVMITRSLEACYILRDTELGVQNVSLSKAAKGSINVYMPDPDAEHEEGETPPVVSIRKSGNELATTGKKAIRKTLGKDTVTSARKPSPPATALADSSKALAAMLSSDAMVSMPVVGDVDENLTDIMDTLFIRNFADNGKIDFKALKDYATHLQELLNETSKGEQMKQAS